VLSSSLEAMKWYVAPGRDEGAAGFITVSGPVRPLLLT